MPSRGKETNAMESSIPQLVRQPVGTALDICCALEIAANAWDPDELL
jgi:hypothetical protein